MHTLSHTQLTVACWIRENYSTESALFIAGAGEVFYPWLKRNDDCFKTCKHESILSKHVFIV